MITSSLFKQPHRRYNPLAREWILVSPHRTDRPWQGQIEQAPIEERPSYDPTCYLCPGNARAGGRHNPHYQQTFVFDNDFSALLPDIDPLSTEQSGLLVARGERGVCRVICFSPRHDLTLPEMELPDIRRVIDVWTEHYQALGGQGFINHVQIFENKGAAMGASNPHPHCQVWATQSIPTQPARELESLREHLRDKGTCLLCDYLALEERNGERMVCANEHFAALAPFWAVWPFETMLLARRHVACLPDLTGDECNALADIIKRLTTRYDNLFQVSFPYSMGLHQSPTDGQAHPDCHLHAHYYPPLLRSAAVRKFMVGYEMLSEPQRDLTAETSAARLRALSEIHYRERNA